MLTSYQWLFNVQRTRVLSQTARIMRNVAKKTKQKRRKNYLSISCLNVRSWVSQDQEALLELNSKAVNVKILSLIMDVRMLNSATTGSGHKLVLCKMCISIQKCKTQESYYETRLNREFLKESTIHEKTLNCCTESNVLSQENTTDDK